MSLESALSGAVKAEVYLQSNEPEAREFFKAMRANSILGASAPSSEPMCAVPSWALSNATGILMDHQCYDHSWREAFLGMANALRQAGGQLEWWPTEGTLISLMRYGESGQKLPGQQSDIAAGGDIEFMVWAQTQDTFQSIALELLQHLRPNTWHCLEQPTILAQYYWKGTHAESSQFELDYFECNYVSMCDPTHLVQVQLHRYQVNQRLGLAFLQQLGPSGRRPDGVLPWAWRKNSSLPLKAIRPLAKCKAYTLQVPCPRRAIWILERSGEYSKCVALPMVTWARVGLDMRNRDFLRQGLSLADLRYLEEKAKQLHQEGVQSFLPAYVDGGCAWQRMAELVKTASSSISVSERSAKVEDVDTLQSIASREDCKILWETDPVQQFLKTSLFLLTVFEVAIAHGIILLNRRIGLTSLLQWSDRFQPNLQSWQLAYVTQGRLLTWVLEALSFGATDHRQLSETRGFQLLWQHHRDLAINVYLVFRLRSCAPFLPWGRLAFRGATIPWKQAVQSIVRFLRTTPRWLRRSIRYPLDASRKELLRGLGRLGEKFCSTQCSTRSEE
eukprot:symbB.v1.2.019132.t1/scaffold1546.1/size112474/4